MLVLSQRICATTLENPDYFICFVRRALQSVQQIEAVLLGTRAQGLIDLLLEAACNFEISEPRRERDGQNPRQQKQDENAPADATPECTGQSRECN